MNAWNTVVLLLLARVGFLVPVEETGREREGSRRRGGSVHARWFSLKELVPRAK